MATVLLMRHAQAEHGGGSDRERTLTVQGRRDAAEAGRRLSSEGLLPDVVLVSSALRTRQTWDRVRSGLGADPAASILDELYGAGPREVIELLREIDDATVILVIGHEPTMSGTANWLAGHEDSSLEALAMIHAGQPTASIAVLDVEGPLSGLTTMRGFVPPADLEHAARVRLRAVWQNRA